MYKYLSNLIKSILTYIYGGDAILHKLIFNIMSKRQRDVDLIQTCQDKNRRSCSIINVGGDIYCDVCGVVKKISILDKSNSNERKIWYIVSGKLTPEVDLRYGIKTVTWHTNHTYIYYYCQDTCLFPLNPYMCNNCNNMATTTKYCMTYDYIHMNIQMVYVYCSRKCIQWPRIRSGINTYVRSESLYCIICKKGNLKCRILTSGAAICQSDDCFKKYMSNYMT